MGCCLTLGNEMSEETQVLRKQEILFGKGGEQKGKGTGRTALLCGSLQFYGDGISLANLIGN